MTTTTACLARCAQALLIAATAACGDPVAEEGAEPDALTDTSPEASTDALDTLPPDRGDGAPADTVDGRGPDDWPPQPITREGAWFVDIAAEAGIDLDRTPANGYWGAGDRMSGGVCVLDADGIPPLDLFFAARPGPTAGSGSRLYVGAGSLTWSDETAARGLSDAGDSVGCLAFDADGDGDEDLLVTGVGTLRLFRSDDGHFTDVSDRLDVVIPPDAVLSSASAGDLDRDGTPELLVGLFTQDPLAPAPADACVAASPPADCVADPVFRGFFPNLLLAQGSDGVYRDTSATRAPALLLEEPTLAVGIHDVNDDGLLDLFIGNDVDVPNRWLVQHMAGNFTDVAFELEMDLNQAGLGMNAMGWSTGDLNSDGRLDYVVSDFQGAATAVFVCQSDGACPDEGPDRGMTTGMYTTRWAEALADMDLDGDLDLFEVTGQLYLDAENLQDAFGPHAQQPLLWLNDGAGLFEPAQVATDDGLAVARPGRGLAVVDLDDDGRLDLVIAPNLGPPALLLNVHPTDGHWVRFSGVDGRPLPVGTRLEITAPDGRQHLRVRLAGEGFQGSYDPRIHVGLGDAAGPLSVRVRWPDGRETHVDDLAPGRTHALAPDHPEAGP